VILAEIFLVSPPVFVVVAAAAAAADVVVVFAVDVTAVAVGPEIDQFQINSSAELLTDMSSAELLTDMSSAELLTDMSSAELLTQMVNVIAFSWSSVIWLRDQQSPTALKGLLGQFIIKYFCELVFKKI
jgi:hypothetical protein